MPITNAIQATVFCSNHNIDYQFIEQLRQNDLIHTSIESGTLYIPEEELPKLEKMVRLRFEMDINIEGIETINYLLNKIENMQQEIMQLRNRVAVFTTE